MDAVSLIHAVAPVGAVGAALVLLGRGRLALAGGYVLLGAATLAIGSALVPNEGDVLARGPVVLAGFAGVALLLTLLAFAFVRAPAAIPLVLACVAPFRIPVTFGENRALLLVPLYAVLVSAVLALLVRVVRRAEMPAPPLFLAVPATALVAVAALSSLWSVDVEGSARKLFFFYFPLVALLGVVARTPPAAWLTRALAVAAVAVAAVLGVVGLWQLQSRDLVFARDLEMANAYASFFRTTSVFRDPSIYGRHLVLAILVVVVALWLGRVRLWLGAAAAAFLGTALFFTYSQSSMVALGAGLVFVTLVAADRRSKVIVLAATLAVVVAMAAVLVPAAQTQSLLRVTSGRSDLALNALEIAADHPLAGVGVGAEEHAAKELAREHPGRLAKASHTTPLVVAAELGALGLLAYLGLLAAAGRAFLLTARRSRALGTGLGAVFFAVFVHSLFYSGFFEDPLVWLALGLAAAALVTPAAPARDDGTAGTG